LFMCVSAASTASSMSTPSMMYALNMIGITCSVMICPIAALDVPG
jgi:hypothetical protein